MENIGLVACAEKSLTAGLVAWLLRRRPFANSKSFSMGLSIVGFGIETILKVRHGARDHLLTKVHG